MGGATGSFMFCAWPLEKETETDACWQGMLSRVRVGFLGILTTDSNQWKNFKRLENELLWMKGG